MCWLSTAMISHYRTPIRNILLEMSYYYNINPKRIALLLSKWDLVIDFQPIHFYSLNMRIALGWMRRRKFVLISLIIVIVTILITTYLFLGRI